MNADKRSKSSETKHVEGGGLIIPIYSTQLVREYTLSFNKREQISTPSQIAKLLSAYFILHDREEFLVCFLDTAMTLTGMCSISIGGLNQTVVEPRSVFKGAILANAHGIIISHNHPSGNPEPSKHDIEITKRLHDAGEILGIPVFDHLIIAEDDYTSLTERGLV